MKKYAKMAIKTGGKTKSYVAVGHAYELVGLHHEYGNNNLDSAAIYYKRFVDVSEKIDYKKGSTDASRHLSNLLIKQGKKDEGLLYMDSSIDIARKYGDNAYELALILPKIYADLLLEDGQIEQAISILEEADGLAQNINRWQLNRSQAFIQITIHLLVT